MRDAQKVLVQARCKFRKRLVTLASLAGFGAKPSKRLMIKLRLESEWPWHGLKALVRPCIALAMTLGSLSVALGQGELHFTNFDPPFVNAPVFDNDCATKLEGSAGFAAQLYAGSTPTTLAAIGSPT